MVIYGYKCWSRRNLSLGRRDQFGLSSLEQISIREVKAASKALIKAILTLKKKSRFTLRKKLKAKFVFRSLIKRFLEITAITSPTARIKSPRHKRHTAIDFQQMSADIHGRVESFSEEWTNQGPRARVIPVDIFFKLNDD